MKTNNAIKYVPLTVEQVDAVTDYITNGLACDIDVDEDAIAFDCGDPEFVRVSVWIMVPRKPLGLRK